MNERSAVITGMGCVCAAGTSPDSVLDALEEGRRTLSSSRILGEHAMPFPFFAAPEVIFSGGRRFSVQDTLTLARFAAVAALTEAGLPHDGLPSMGVVAGTTAGSALHFLRDYAASRVIPPAFAPPFSPAEEIMGQFSDSEDYLRGNLALALLPEGRGPRVTLVNACTSGADALGLTLDCIRLGVADCMLCGGADALSLIPHSGFARLMIFSDEPCRPFDVMRRGLNLGEGAAMLVLESEKYARARGAHILGRVLGYGATADAHHFTAPHPEGRGLAQAISKALADAAVFVENLAFINAHGTATLENDKVEGQTLRTQAPNIPIWASKGGTGHTLGAAGALEAVLTVQALRRGRVPPSLGFERGDPAIGVVPTTATLPLFVQPFDGSSSFAGRRALSTSLGFGGGNATLVLEGECL